MKVLYDHQTFTIQDFGGVSRIYTELLKNSFEHGVDVQLSLLLSNSGYLKELVHVKFYNFFPSVQSYYKMYVMMNLNKRYSIHQLKNAKFDVFHPTYYDPYFLKYLKGKPYVVTFLDLIHEKFGDKFRELANDKTILERKQTLLRNAAKVIAISECTKRDIIEVFNTDKDKIDVIYLGNSLNSHDDAGRPRLIPHDYLLFVGKRESYKNFNFFLKAISDILRSHGELKLVCAGGGAVSDEEAALLETLKIKDKVAFLSVASDATLVNLYSNAVCFIFPSLYEGFGIPVLEAFSCGCPVVLSNRGSLPEIAGEAVVYCDPEDAHSIQNAVKSLLTDSGLRRKKAMQGAERLQYFSWDKTRRQTFDLYKTLV